MCSTFPPPSDSPSGTQDPHVAVYQTPHQNTALVLQRIEQREAFLRGTC